MRKRGRQVIANREQNEMKLLIAQEEWKTLVKFPEYKISSLGRLRRIGQAHGARIGRILKPRKTKWGYIFYSLWQNNKEKHVHAHRLVAFAFLGFPPSEKHTDVAHKDGNKINNRLTNLYWATRSQNEFDKAKHGTDCRGENHYGAKLKEPQVIRIRKGGKTVTERQLLALEFGVSLATIYDVQARRSWRCVA